MRHRTADEDAALRQRIRDRMRVEDRGADTPCWVSNRVAQPNGYTKIGYRGKTYLTHRLAYEVFVGPIDESLVIDHLCRVRPCVNPDHMEPVTTRENLMRGETITAAEVAATHCVNGHEFTEANTYVRPDRYGRLCRTCRTEVARRKYARIKAAREASAA